MKTKKPKRKYEKRFINEIPIYLIEKQKRIKKIASKIDAA